MPRIAPAVAFAAALVALSPLPSHGGASIRLDLAPEWREADDMQTLVPLLDDWLDAHSEWPRRAAPPRVRIVAEQEARARQGTTVSMQRGRLRGLYDPDRGEILLVEPWDPDRAEDVSVLLHELVHHRQSPHHWYCPAEQELLAYRLQEAWLAERGLQADVNWMAVVLDAGCTPRDIHPD